MGLRRQFAVPGAKSGHSGDRRQGRGRLSPTATAAGACVLEGAGRNADRQDGPARAGSAAQHQVGMRALRKTSRGNLRVAVDVEQRSRLPTRSRASPSVPGRGGRQLADSHPARASQDAPRAPSVARSEAGGQPPPQPKVPSRIPGRAQPRPARPACSRAGSKAPGLQLPCGLCGCGCHSVRVGVGWRRRWAAAAAAAPAAPALAPQAPHTRTRTSTAKGYLSVPRPPK
ncbi:hypothetical protein PCL_01324 [Purpureocillium lilacinum]|uniref:Uncharacterized protein n=1 Tax=Purpureocillium lilacinum TaxID=33203 RepID=A0A2U3E379_PURLI|nr:hypothetical protein PCL_01324 [Purpureocillium lilacinum]